MNTGLCNNTTMADRTAKDAFLAVVESTILGAINIAALVGNSLVCLAFYRKSSIRSKVTNYFVVSLAVTDLAVALVVMPLTVASTIANQWIFGTVGCKISFFVGFICGGTSLLTTILLAINRYFCVVRRDSYNVIFSRQYSLAMTVAAWIVAMVGTILIYYVTPMMFRVYAIQPSICFRVASTTRYVLSVKIVRCVFIAVPGFVVVCCYVRIYRTIKMHNNNRKMFSKQCSLYGVDAQKTTRILTVVVVWFYLSWSPIFLNNILTMFNLYDDEAALKYSNLHYTIPLFASSVVNPIIYAVLGTEFREEFRKICSCGK